jgi:hypothetical protein
MSAWSIGALTAVPQASAEGVAAAGSDEPVSFDTLVKWIPGEVIAAYAAVVLALQPEQKEGSGAPAITITASGWLIGAIAFAAVLTFLAGWSKTDDLDSKKSKELGVRVLLSALAFAIWSFVVPASWWYSIDQLAENQKLVPIVAGLVGTAFALFAEGVVRRVAR